MVVLFVKHVIDCYQWKLRDVCRVVVIACGSYLFSIGYVYWINDTISA